jgi:tetratricopeptide (TPR) repeat protein
MSELVAVLMLGLFLIPGSEARETQEQHYRAAQEAMRQENWDEAKRQLDQALRAQPRSSATHLLAGRICRLSGDFAKAEHHLKECKRLQGQVNEALQLEWLLYRAQTGEIDLVAPGLLAALENKDQEKAAILEALAAGYLAERRWGKALQALSRWLKIEPENAKALDWRGQARLALGSREDAFADFERALKIDPKRFHTRLHLIDGLLAALNLPQAQAHLDVLRKGHPNLPQVLFALARCRLLQGKRAEARKYLDRLLATNPEDVQGLAYLGNLECEENNLEKAEKLLRQAIRANPADVESRFHLYQVLLRDGRKKEADSALKNYKQIMQDVERLQMLLTKKIETNPGDAQVPLEIGETYQRLGHDAIAVYWLQAALKRDPELKSAHRLLAEFYSRTNQPGKAEWHRSRAKE